MQYKLRDSVVQQTYNKLNIYFPFPPTVVIFTISKFASISAKKNVQNCFVNCNKNIKIGVTVVEVVVCHPVTSTENAIAIYFFNVNSYCVCFFPVLCMFFGIFVLFFFIYVHLPALALFEKYLFVSCFSFYNIYICFYF